MWAMLREYSAGDISPSFKISGTDFANDVKLIYGVNEGSTDSTMFLSEGTEFTVDIDGFDPHGGYPYQINIKLKAPNLVDYIDCAIYLSELD